MVKAQFVGHDTQDLEEYVAGQRKHPLLGFCFSLALSLSLFSLCTFILHMYICICLCMYVCIMVSKKLELPLM